ncbi:MAG: cardiolipin synthase [Coriobacteriia bacterium]|nr:cardiolipin synthase [Coriobacteriia bacterium]
MTAAVTLIVELAGAAFTLAAVGLIFVLIYEERDPSTTLAWVLLLTLFPVGGVLLYVVFGRNWRNIGAVDRKRVAALKRGQEALQPIYARHARAAAEFVASGAPDVSKLSSAIRAQNGTEPLLCFDPEIFSRGAEKFERLLRDIEAATDHVHLEYFIWEQDALTKRYCDLLAEKLRQGVEVRVLYDWVGSVTYGKKQLAALERAGASVQADAAELGRLNYRNHRKIAVVDGRIAYTGGMNMGKEYIDGKPRYESWRDTHVRFGGPLVADLQRLFCERWMRTTREDLFSERYFPAPAETPERRAVWAQVVHSGPESRFQAVRNAFLLAIASADRRVRIQSPYFVPDEAIQEALVAQSLAGIDMQLMMTGVPDKRIPWWAAYTYVDDLVEAGCRVFQYGAGFFHAKTMTVDGTIAIIGTTNYDIRSFALHDELSIVFYDQPMAAELDAIFDDDVTRCVEITRADIHSVGRLARMRNAAARLSSRLL